MIKTSKLMLIAAIAAASIASPVFAQSRDNGRDAYDMYDMVPPHASVSPATDPAYTGGGSSGYNENLLKNQW
jgi:hypothetical protein